ncbi:substrate-binding domain-containing protein [Bacillus sp. ISL-51]|uniref:LacI family DNA-binding transcriptional regulator n=1 Tax=Bacteria TaxID=2 RepID=UPI001BEA11B2|nr:MULTISPECIES: substrate-binding domain-containing protein [Bacteria]MBT2575145.1 substrate-binding domain-containing protein [Bacillus sp. ISL-51]MBT2633441.1 substrate-binding domain-containing protein [Bacillus sp. ISL-26]MBT2714134.1 substrate-binding domain-containing protein [Pseudomonas sp. ISL-88]
MKTITIADVAKHANVSKSTVSQFLNRRFDYMSEKTKQKIEAAIQELNYQPNFVARSLKQKSTFTVGVVVANILHTFSTQVIRAIEDYFHEQGFHIIVCNADDEPAKEKKYIEMLRAKQVDGIIIFPTGENLSLYEKMKRDEFPIVFMDRTIEELGIQTVMLDNHYAAKLAVDRFAEKGLHRIAIITTSIIRKISPRVERIEGYKKALERHGLPIREEYIKTADTDDIPRALSELFALNTPPEAILAGNDIVLVEALKYMKEKNMAIPEDAAVIGIDEVSFASFFTPPVTTIVQPAVEMAKGAADILLRQIQKKESEAEWMHRYKPSLMARHSG